MTAITLLTAPSCRLCDDAKVVLDRVAIDFDLTLELVSLDTPRGQELMTKHQVVFPPGVLVDGEPFSYGRLSERRLRRELENRKSLRARRRCQSDMMMQQAKNLHQANRYFKQGEEK
ncbi:MAG TPA: glutaredoxin family protein [Acidimicrobiales bacterium]